MHELYPYGTERLLKPEVYNEPLIIPRQVIFHTHGFAGSSESVGNYFDKDTIHVESTASVKLDGRLLQFQHINRQADAQAAGNGYRLPNNPAGPLYGAVSLEHEEDGSGRFTQAQVLTDGLFLAWMNLYWGIPLRFCRTRFDPGIGYHRQFPEWNPNRHGCPYDGQVAQLFEILNVANWFRSGARPVNTEIVDRFETPLGHRWALQRDGGVITEAGNEFYGSYPGLPEHARRGDRYFVDIGPRGDGEPGYILTSNRGEKYLFPYVG